MSAISLSRFALNLFKSLAEPRRTFISLIFGNSIVKVVKLSVFDSLRITLCSVLKPHFLHFLSPVRLILPHLLHLPIITYPHFLQVLPLLIVLQTGQTTFRTFLQFGQTIVLSSISNPHFGHSIT